MEKTINIFDVEMGCVSAKEAMMNALHFLENDSLDTIELMTMDMLMTGQDDPEWKKQVCGLDLVLPEETEILKAAGIEDRTLLKEAEERTFLRMFMKYLQKNEGRIFLLAGSDEELGRLEDSLRRYNRGVRVVGHAVFAETGGMEADVINDINGTETDCIFSVLRSPYQEHFITANKAFLKAKVWLGCGTVLGQSYDARRLGKRFKRFIMKSIFRYRVEQQKE